MTNQAYLGYVLRGYPVDKGETTLAAGWKSPLMRLGLTTAAFCLAWVLKETRSGGEPAETD